MSDKHLSQLLDFIASLGREEYQRSPWCPLADVYRCGYGWVVKLDLAGVRIEDVQMNVAGRRLTVQGLRRDWLCGEGHQCHSMEIAYNRFERAIEFPCDLEQVEITSEYDDGMLLIHLSLRAAAR